MKLSIQILLLIILFPFVTGCYDLRELNETGFVTALGVDLGSTNRYRVSVQVVNPSNSAGGTFSKGPTSLDTVTYSAEGDNVFQASRKISKMISRQLHYGHTILVAISEDLARKEGLYNMLDGIERDSEIRSSASIILTKGISAEKLLRNKAIIDRISAMKVKRLTKFSQNLLGENPDTRLYQVIRTLTSSGRNAMVNGFEIVQTPQAPIVVLDSLGVFQEGKLVHWLDSQSSRGVMWVLDKVRSTLVSLDVNGQKNSVGIEPIRTKANVKAISQQGKPKMQIHIEVDANIGEVETNIDILDPFVILELEKLTEDAIRAEVNQAITKLQALHCDIFGFGDVVHQYEPGLWRHWQKDWSDKGFPELQHDLQLTVRIQRLGLRTNSLIRNIELNNQGN
ncbi:Ger(x)C family spore germination protein [Paenibacillus sp. 1001270B_150601_E10]|uniref:Ger(x)C family spore germination protein n=1 Tax=Paenibacillus sp. 1001270B_150601_E10 TaxID=2787079 RepID=UPI00189D8D96|nr:Ger(x)C family spore germination protein [Paenibacillus sp. 1001270B_150601_E10]